jgi:hypothetical protein
VPYELLMVNTSRATGTVAYDDTSVCVVAAMPCASAIVVGEVALRRVPPGQANGAERLDEENGMRPVAMLAIGVVAAALLVKPSVQLLISPTGETEATVNPSSPDTATPAVGFWDRFPAVPVAIDPRGCEVGSQRPDCLPYRIGPPTAWPLCGYAAPRPWWPSCIE